ncbi:phage holin family protein [Ornithinimicrobium pekingense]|nr:phage holin family protein [Ornithinimicrobium pekingense]
MKMILTIIADAVAIWVAAYLISGIEIGGEGTSFWLTLLAVAVIFGVLNAVVKPILKLLSLPLIVLTLGLFLFVLNAIMLSLTSWLAGVLGLDFTVESFFWDAVLGAIIVSAVSLVVDMLLPDGKER